jgi:hypothetical protein
MLKAEDNVEEVPPPPPKGDASGGKITPIVGTLKGSRVEQLSPKLMKLKLQRKIDKLKKKLKDFKSRQLTSSSSSNEETNDSFKEEVKGKRGRKGDKRSYKTTSFNYDIILPLTPSPRYPLVKPLISMGQTIPNGDTGRRCI